MLHQAFCQNDHQNDHTNSQGGYTCKAIARRIQKCKAQHYQYIGIDELLPLYGYAVAFQFLIFCLSS